MLLLALHVLFAVTGVMAALIAHIKLSSTTGTEYHSQLKWLIITFWVALVGYIAAFTIWLTSGVLWPALIVLGWIGYRLFVNFRHWKNHQPLNRLL